MFIVLLRFSAQKHRARELMEEHNRWIARGLEDGVFLVVGSLRPEGGGGILAHGISAEDLRARVDADPFVAHDVVRPEIIELAPSKAAEPLRFLLG